MRARVIRRDGELTVTIPDEIASRAEISENREVELQVDGRNVIISPPEQEMSLSDMLDRITPENRHELVDFGAPVGKEVW
jgi:antitoxin MazE